MPSQSLPAVVLKQRSTHERVDKPRGEFFHTNWAGISSRVASSAYAV